LSQVKKIVADEGSADDGFGSAIAISGDRIVVGMPGDDSLSTDAGSAFIFARNQGGNNNWGQEAKISVNTLFHLGSAEKFGLVVAIDGDNVVIGAPGTDGNGIDSGRAYLFNRNEGGDNSWGKVTDLSASDGAAYYEFAISVSISGEFVTVGSPNDNNAKGSSAGAVYIYKKDEGGANSWGELKKILSNDGIALDYFGTSVSIAGDYAVVGAQGQDTLGPRTANGAAYILENAVKAPIVSGVFFPHVANNNGWETEIALINSGDKAISAQLISYDDNGSQVGNPTTITLNPMSRRQIAVGTELGSPLTATEWQSRL